MSGGRKKPWKSNSGEPRRTGKMEKIWWQRLTGEAKAEYDRENQRFFNDEITEEEFDVVCDRLRAELEASERKPLQFNQKNGGGHWVNGLSATCWVDVDGTIHVKTSIPGQAQLYESMIADEPEYKRIYG